MSRPIGLGGLQTFIAMTKQRKTAEAEPILAVTPLLKLPVHPTMYGAVTPMLGLPLTSPQKTAATATWRDWLNRSLNPWSPEFYDKAKSRELDAQIQQRNDQAWANSQTTGQPFNPNRASRFTRNGKPLAVDSRMPQNQHAAIVDTLDAVHRNPATKEITPPSFSRMSDSETKPVKAYGAYNAVTQNVQINPRLSNDEITPTIGHEVGHHIRFKNKTLLNWLLTKHLYGKYAPLTLHEEMQAEDNMLGMQPYMSDETRLTPQQAERQRRWQLYFLNKGAY